jgi:hypothetical protein
VEEDRRSSQDSGSTAYYSATEGEEPSEAQSDLTRLTWPDPDSSWFKNTKAALESGPVLAAQSSAYFNADRDWTLGLAASALSAPLMTMYEQVYRAAKKTPGSPQISYAKLAGGASAVAGAAITSSGDYIQLRGLKTTGAVFTAVSKVLAHYAERNPPGTYPPAGAGDLELGRLSRAASLSSGQDNPGPAAVERRTTGRGAVPEPRPRRR